MNLTISTGKVTTYRMSQSELSDELFDKLIDDFSEFESVLGKWFLKHGTFPPDDDERKEQHSEKFMKFCERPERKFCNAIAKAIFKL